LWVLSLRGLTEPVPEGRWAEIFDDFSSYVVQPFPLIARRAIYEIWFARQAKVPTTKSVNYC
jgi:hypothetical protein